MTDKPRRVTAAFKNEQGQLILRIGSDLLDDQPIIAQQIGRFAAAWAQTEAELGGYLASLLRTDPDRTFAILGRYHTAKSYADAAKDLIKVSLSQPKCDEALALISEFNSLAQERNAVQHCLWASIPTHPNSLFRVKASDWSMMALRLTHVGKDSADDAIKLAEETASKITDEYTAERLDALVERSQALSCNLFELTSQELQAMLGTKSP